MKYNSKSIEDIKSILKILEDSSRFLSSSGLSGVFAGITAMYIKYGALMLLTI